MAVAKSYQNLEIAKEPYMVNGRMYVQVKLGNGNLKQVRWYSDREYAKLYGTKPDHSNDPYYKTQKEVLGFKNGFITIFKGNTYAYKEWFKEQGARYTKHWGWSFSSEMEVPTDLPEGVEAIKLEWDAVGNGDELKPDAQVKAAVEALMYEPSNSQFVGAVGDRLELWLTVEKVIELDGYYGRSYMHIMYDEDENTYLWTTASAKWDEGEEYHIKGTVKDHRTYKGVNQTVLTRCAKVKVK